MDAKSPRRLIDRFVHTRHRHTDASSANKADERMDEAQPDSSTASQADADSPTTWSDIGATPVSTGRGSDDTVQLPESRAEPGGVPVYADPNMVTPQAAEKMRPLFRRGR
jgi:hypothetical protein